MIKVRVMNEYQIDEMLKSEDEINYDNFYKDQLIDMLKVCRDKYKKELERKNKLIEFNQIVSNSDYVYSQDVVANRNLRILGGDIDE